jgi:hypothetical protein
MASISPKSLSPSFSVEFDRITDSDWYCIIDEFEDANIYQTWAYASTLTVRGRVGSMILRKNGEIAAAALIRITKAPLVRAGIAYVMFGPMWRRRGIPVDLQVLQQAVRALRNEYVCRRGLVLRVFPTIFDEGASCNVVSALQSEGLEPSHHNRGRTILMDVSSPIELLRAGLRPHWGRELKVAEKKNLQVVEGTGDELFDSFISIYKEMVSRKKFAEPNDVHQFRRVQSLLPDRYRMKVLLCMSGGQVCSGVVCSAMGNTALYLFGATSSAGLKSRGSYLLQWKYVEGLKQKGTSVYNLNGINPTANPGTYKFKNDLAGSNGRDLHYLGRFECREPVVSRVAIACGEALRAALRDFKNIRKLPVCFRSPTSLEHSAPQK